MRRARQQLSREQCEDILCRGTSGVLAVLGDEGYPYAVPMSYVYEAGKLWFHSACQGHKVDALAACDKVSFCVIDRDEVIPEEYTTCYRSVIAFGRMHIMEQPEECRAAIEKLALKYAPDSTQEHRAAAIDRETRALCMLEMTVEQLTGKEARELARLRDDRA